MSLTPIPAADIVISIPSPTEPRPEIGQPDHYCVTDERSRVGRADRAGSIYIDSGASLTLREA
jgi:hypothetical protein